MFAYPCPSCHQRLLAPAGRGGQRSICPKCLHPLTVPHPEQVAAGPFAPSPAEEFSPADDCEISGRFAPPMVDAELDTPVPTNTLLPDGGFEPVPLTAVTEPFLDLPPVRSVAETATPAPLSALAPALNLGPKPTPAPRPSLRGDDGRVVLAPTGLFAVDVAAELSAAISMRMAPPPLPAADRTLPVVGWFVASTVGLAAWGLGVWTSAAWLPYVALVGGGMVLFGLLWRAYLSGRGGAWAKGLATLLPPLCVFNLLRRAEGYGHKPLLFVLTGAVLCGLFAGGPAARKWVEANIDPTPTADAKPEVQKRDDLTALDGLTSTSKADREAARTAAVRIGAKAEPQVRGLLTAKDESAVLTGCDLLEQIGTADSVPALRAVADDPTTSRAVRIEAVAAMEAIRKRTGGK